MTTATTTTTVGSYLATRLVQLGVTHLFGLPGDYNLTLLDEMLATPERHVELLEFFYVCLALGFEGRYRSGEGGRQALTQARTRLYELIEQRQGKKSTDLSARWRGAEVRARRVHLSPKLPFGWVDFPPCVNRLIGLQWLAKILYPDLFPEDLRALTRDFYARFYHVTPSDAQIDRVLAGRD